MTKRNRCGFARCNHGDSLDLTGSDGDYLFGVKGLRTFKMKRTTIN